MDDVTDGRRWVLRGIQLRRSICSGLFLSLARMWKGWMPAEIYFHVARTRGGECALPPTGKSALEELGTREEGRRNGILLGTSRSYLVEGGGGRKKLKRRRLARLVELAGEGRGEILGTSSFPVASSTAGEIAIWRK